MDGLNTDFTFNWAVADIFQSLVGIFPLLLVSLFAFLFWKPHLLLLKLNQTNVPYHIVCINLNFKINSYTSSQKFHKLRIFTKMSRHKIMSFSKPNKVIQRFFLWSTRNIVGCFLILDNQIKYFEKIHTGEQIHLKEVCITLHSRNILIYHLIKENNPKKKNQQSKPNCTHGCFHSRTIMYICCQKLLIIDF